MGRSIRDVIARLPDERKAKVEASAQQKAKEMIAEANSLNALRKALGETQVQVGKTLGIQQNAVSQLEKRTDIYVSTLQKYVKALGMELEITLVNKNGTRIPLPNFRPWEASPSLDKRSNPRPRPKVTGAVKTSATTKSTKKKTTV
ncbi:transcriptional regulator [Janthinobacterium sp. BJB412]|jgi:transcriptional regulator with XRE-family HTH domain|nr:transcriptional regulator [Janthinobacterium sp. BJB412]